MLAAYSPDKIEGSIPLRCGGVMRFHEGRNLLVEIYLQGTLGNCKKTHS